MHMGMDAFTDRICKADDDRDQVIFFFPLKYFFYLLTFVFPAATVTAVLRRYR